MLIKDIRSYPVWGGGRNYFFVVVETEDGITGVGEAGITSRELAIAGARLRVAGRTLISTVGGAAGPLYGTALMRAGGSVAAAADGTATSDVLLAALDAGIGGIAALGKSSAGEKTMLDALMPALEAGRAAAAAGGSTMAVTGAIADAAEAGATATIPMLATKGRASYLGERSIGHQDPGATSSALLLRALADVVAGA